MTQPTTINQTFDTSLIDVQRSFSSTETNTSGSSAKENIAPPADLEPGPPPQNHLSARLATEELYESWASTYDTDGNVLQHVDDLMMKTLMPKFVHLTQHDRQVSRRLRVLDLGCGTGRNTLKLLQADWHDANVDFAGWDSSTAMLGIASRKCAEVLQRCQSDKPSIDFERRTISNPGTIPKEYDGYFDGLITTLVLEHIPIHTFVFAIAKLLKVGGYAMITNMHPDMGALSHGAGFKNAASGERMKGTSYVYSVAETVEAAERAGLQAAGELHETVVEEGMFSDGLVADRAQKWIGTKVWFGMILRKR